VIVSAGFAELVNPSMLAVITLLVGRPEERRAAGEVAGEQVRDEPLLGDAGSLGQTLGAVLQRAQVVVDEVLPRERQSPAVLGDAVLEA
jgi:hypothetical protein